MTGSSGFIGSHLATRLRRRGCQLLTLERDGLAGETVAARAEDPAEIWAERLNGIDSVIHLAGIAHQAADPARIEAINARWPVTLYRAAAEAGVENFLWLSSIKTLGEESVRPFQETDSYVAGGLDAYALGKVRAETGLLALQANFPATRMAILRPPLVYGPGVKANFLSLLKWARRAAAGLPLPLGAATAPRSLIGVHNLCDVIEVALGHRGVFHCADERDLSVAELLTLLGAPAHLLLPVPPGVMGALLRAAGQSSTFQRLYRPLQVDQRQSNQTLGWAPEHSVEAQLAETVAWFLQSR